MISLKKVKAALTARLDEIVGHLEKVGMVYGHQDRGS